MTALGAQVRIRTAPPVKDLNSSHSTAAPTKSSSRVRTAPATKKSSKPREHDTGHRSMSRNKKPPAPAVASTGCSSLMSCLSLRRCPPRPRANDDANGSEAVSEAEQHLKRMQFLEEEIGRLTKWLGQEERTAPAAVSVGRGGVKSVRNVTMDKAEQEGVRNNAKAKEESTGAGTDTATTAATASTNRCVSVGHGAGGVQGMAKLEDGSYLHDVTRVGRPWEWLAVQVSRPVIPKDAASASEALDKMTAMRPNDLCKLLTQMMPLKDIAGRQNPGEPVRRTARLISGDDLVEALVFKAMDKMEGLVLEGLKIQMGLTGADLTADHHRQRHEPVSKNCRVHVVLIQVRDPKERYDAIGEPMIGIVEASPETKDGKVKLEMSAMHVAGISLVKRNSSDGRCMMWIASLRHCKGNHDGGDGCRCKCVRNPNRFFQQ